MNDLLRKTRRAFHLLRELLNMKLPPAVLLF